MDTFISLISDLIILIFDLCLYMKLTALKKDNKLYKGIMLIGVFLITAAYVIVAYGLHVSYSAASFLCMTVPSFLLFLWLSRYKNARFLVTFCFVDTVTFIIAAIGKIALIIGGAAGGILSCLVMLTLTVTTFLLLRPYCSKYRELMEQVSKGWAPMAVSTVFIYILLVASAAYPKPLIQRLEYLPIYLFLCCTILSFYFVFIILLLQKSKLRQANILLQQQQHWHDLAFLDELTQLANPAAYAARVKSLEKGEDRETVRAVMLFDIDNFKNVNDTYGHHVGNKVLKNTADFFRSTFPQQNYEFFRVGGDEFAAIVSGLSQEEIRKKVTEINEMPLKAQLGCTYSCGYAMVDFSLETPFEQAFIQADQAMYSVKSGKKHS